MPVLKQLPFVKLLIPLLFGITSTLFFPSIGSISGVLVILLSVVFIVFHFLRFMPRAYTLANISVYVLLIALGSWLTIQTGYTKKPSKIQTDGPPKVYLIQIQETPQEKLKSSKLNAKIIGRIDKNYQLIKSEDYALIYLTNEKIHPRLGDLCIVRCIFNPIPEPENRYQFNYKRYLKIQGIAYQAFIKDKNAFVITGINRAPILKKIAEEGSNFLKTFYRRAINDPVSLGVVEALIFGYKDDLPKNLIDAYSRTGTLHVLAVSGLHVAIVFLMLAQCLWFLDKIKYGLWLKTVIVLICIWGYCLLTGLSPSIIRAGLMISLILLGKVLNRNANIFNILAASAFILLCINPLWLLNIGFQLSFAAVFGIVLLQDYILPLWTAPNWFWRQVWTIMVISFCAQLTTFPLSLYYFHQFPNYFLLSNLLIIPLSTLVIYTGIAMVVCAKIPILLSFLTVITENTVRLTNYLIVTIEQWPYSYTDGIKLNHLQFSVLFLAILSFSIWFIKANKNYFIAGAVCLMGLSILTCIDCINQRLQNHFILFNIPNQNSILLSDGKKSLLITDEQDPNKDKYYMRTCLIQYRIWPVTKTYLFKDILTKSNQINDMDFYTKKGVIFFKGMVLNASPKNIGRLKWKQSYIVPKSFNFTYIFPKNMTDTIHVGQDKSKRLQKKMIKYFANYHNCVIYNSAFKDLIH